MIDCYLKGIGFNFYIIRMENSLSEAFIFEYEKIGYK